MDSNYWYRGTKAVDFQRRVSEPSFRRPAHHARARCSQLQFFPKLAAFDIGWRERPRRRIGSFIEPRGCLTRPGLDNQTGDHSHYYPGFPALRRDEAAPA